MSLTFAVESSEHEASREPVWSHLIALTSPWSNISYLDINNSIKRKNFNTITTSVSRNLAPHYSALIFLKLISQHKVY